MRKNLYLEKFNREKNVVDNFDYNIITKLDLCGIDNDGWAECHILIN